MMKAVKPRLVLNKRTLAHLNNPEMRYVRGGDGDEVLPTRNNCGDENTIDQAGSIVRAATKAVLSMLIKIC